VSQTEEERERLAVEAQARQRKWLRILLLLSLVVLLLLMAAELPAPQSATPPPKTTVVTAPDDQLLVPGERVGFLNLGINIALVEERLGRGQAKPTQTAVLYRFPQAGISCAVNKSQVVSILVNNPNFHTAKGVQVGSDADAVVRELGDQYEYDGAERPAPNPETSFATPVKASPTPQVSEQTYTLHYWREGIHLFLRGDKVESILVSAKADEG